MQEWVPTFAKVNMLYLLPIVGVMLILLRLLQMRRREVLAGSLMIWRRLETQQSKIPPRRKVLELLDRSLFFQCAAAASLILAFANPSLPSSLTKRAVVVLMIDNGPESRAVVESSTGLMRIKKKAAEFLKQLSSNPDQEVLLCRSAPFPALLSSNPVSPAQAERLLDALAPCISAPDVEACWLFAIDTARSHGKNPSLPLQVISLRSPPQALSQGQGAGSNWACVTPQTFSMENVGIVAFGSARVPRQPNAEQPKAGSENANSVGVEIQLLVRLKNFSTKQKRGKVILRTLSANNEAAPLEERDLTLAPNRDESLVFVLNTLTAEPLSITWKPVAETTENPSRDDFVDDNTILLAPHPNRDFKIRFNAPLLALEDIYKRSLDAQILTHDDPQGADMEIYTLALPKQIPAHAKAVLLIAPTTGYRGIFDVGPTRLKTSEVQHDEDDPLTRHIAEQPENSFHVANAVEILHTGDYQSLLKDRVSGRTLVARFQDEGRVGYLLAFTPGAGMPEGYLLTQSGLPLYTLLIRIAKVSAGLSDPYSAQRLAIHEDKTGLALPNDWTTDAQFKTQGGGILDERISTLNLGIPAAETGTSLTTHSVERQNSQRNNLAPWLALLGLLLIVVELHIRIKN